jgi:hypothetical protein
MAAAAVPLPETSTWCSNPWTLGGDAIPMVLAIGGVVSNTVTIALQ